MKNNKFTMTLAILILIFVSIGSSLAFFNSRIIGDKKLETTSYEFSVDLQITALNSSNSLIPMNDEDYLKAYKNNCKDKNGYDACSLYKLTLTNNGDLAVLNGLMEFSKSNVVNLSYAILDSSEEEFIAPTKILEETNFSIGENISINPNEVKEYYLIIWLSNILDIGQENIDAGGTFSATVMYNSVNGNSLKGTISQN